MNDKPIIGFITQGNGFKKDNEKLHCGIGIRGKLTADILTKIPSNKYKFVVGFIMSQHELETFIIENKPSLIIYNYHGTSTNWLNDDYIRNKYNNIIHIMIHYDLLQSHVDNFSPNNFNGFKYIITDNDKINNKNCENVFIVTRSVPFINDINIDENRVDKIPIIGFQGFGFKHKGIDRLAHKIQEEFDEAIFRLHMPFSYYCDPYGYITKQVIDELHHIIKKPGIKIEVSHDFMSEEDIVKWLNKNTINCYFFDYLENSGIASSPDYAIASFRPIAVNNSRMLVHLHNLEPTIEIEKSSLREIINNGIKPLYPIYNKYRNENVLKDYENICDKVLNKINI